MAFKQISLFFYLLLLTAPLLAEVRDPAWEKYITSQRDLQTAVYEFAHLQHENENYDIKLLKIHRELQLALIEQKNFRYYDLFSKHPESISRDLGFATFIQFPWTEADEKSLKKDNRAYRKLAKKIKKKKKKLEGSADYPLMTEKFILLSNSPTYQELQKRFLQIPAEVENILDQQTHKFAYLEYHNEAR